MFFSLVFLSCVDFFSNLDLYLFPSLLYSTQVYSFAAVPAICWLCLQFKEFELYWGAVFLRLEEEYWRSPFFNQFYWSDFWSGKWNAWKNLDFGAEQKWRAERKESGFCSYRCFERARNWCVKKFSLSERILFTCGILKQFFFHLFWLRGLVTILF